MFNQGFGTAMETKSAPLYACFTIGYQEKITLLFSRRMRVNQRSFQTMHG